MDELASTEFRKTYGALRKPTAVTVNGHIIGQWIPAAATIPVREYAAWVPNPEVVEKTAQAARDDLLRKINRR